MFGQDDETNLELSYFITIFPATSTLLFPEMRGQFVYQKIKEKERKTEGRKEERKIFGNRTNPRSYAL